MLTWLHEKFVKPLARPPAHLKGHVAGLEFKYQSYFFIYGLLIRIPMLLYNLLIGNMGPVELIVMIAINSIAFTAVAFRLHGVLRVSLIILVYLFSPLAWKFGTMQGYYMPFGAVFVLFSVGVSKLTLLINFLMNVAGTYFYLSKKLDYLVQTATREELAHALQHSLSMMLRYLYIVFFLALIKLHYAHKLSEKLRKCQNIVAEQNISLKKTNEDLKNALEEKDTFILSFSHETRNPLNGILGNLYILSDMHLQPEVKKFIDRAMVCAQILKNILTTIIDSRKSQHSASNLHLVPTSIEVRKFIEEISLLCKDLVQGNGLKYKLNISPNFPQSMVFDRERITQVILNLVSNAIKFTQKGYVRLSFEWKSTNSEVEEFLDIRDRAKFRTSLDIVFRESFGTQKNSYHSGWFRRVNTEEKGNLVISVKDTGCGISEENQKIIFEKFRQVESGNDHIKLGLGLGLWISQVITKLHGGELSLKSEEGDGSCFSVVIPTVATPLVSPSKFHLGSDEELDISASSEGRTEVRALVVEDFPINQIINMEMLKKYGINEICVAANGQECIKTLQVKGSGYFDVITMDLEMPVMGGKEAIKWIRNWEEKNSKTPSKIVIISGNAMEKEIQICTDKAGPYRADAFMAKPCDYHALIKTLGNLGVRPANKKPLQAARLTKKKKKILFADDEYIIIDIMKNFAAKLNLEVLTAKDGKEAVEVFERNNVDIGAIFLDDRMPLMTGLEACKEIRALMNGSNLPNIPIYLVSGTIYETMPSGFTQTLVKPFEYNNFKAIIQQAKFFV